MILLCHGLSYKKIHMPEFYIDWHFNDLDVMLNIKCLIYQPYETLYTVKSVS